MNRAEYERKKREYLAKKKRNQKIRVILRWVVLVLVVAGIVAGLIGILSKTKKDPSKESKTTPVPTAGPGVSKAPTPTEEVTPVPTSTPTPTPTPNFVSMIAVGDNLYDWDMLEDGDQKNGKVGDGQFDFTGWYDNIRPYVRMADFAVINQETPLGGDFGYNSSDTEVKFIGQKNRWGSYHGYPTFNTPYEASEEFVKIGFNIVTSATNHSSDHGYKAIQKTLEYWKTQHPEVAVAGIHDSEESKNTITVVEKYGIKIAILNYTYGLNLTTALKEAPYSVDVLEPKRVKSDVEKAKQLADFVVVFPHWGKEYELSVIDDQKDWAKRFAEYGVDAVIGAHPHICEPMEFITRPDGEVMPVYYSLGNFISIFKNADCELEGMAYLEFVKDGDRKYIRESTVIPLVNHYNYDKNRFRSRCNFTVYALQDYTEELEKAHGCLKFEDGKKFSKKRMEDLAKQLWGDNIKVVDWNNINGVSSR